MGLDTFPQKSFPLSTMEMETRPPCFALCDGIVYLVLAPWTDADSTSLHWPLSAYFPLLVFVPRSMEELRALIEIKYNSRIARNTLAAVPTIGFFGTLVALTSIGSQAFQLPLQTVIGPGVLSNKMAGWTEFATYSSQLITDEFPGPSPIIVSDNYYTAGQIAFAGVSSNSLTSNLPDITSMIVKISQFMHGLCC